MQEFVYLDHVGSVENCIESSNRFYWNLSIVERGGKWAVFGGEKPIFKADSREAIDAFSVWDGTSLFYYS